MGSRIRRADYAAFCHASETIGALSVSLAAPESNVWTAPPRPATSADRLQIPIPPIPIASIRHDANRRSDLTRNQTMKSETARDDHPVKRSRRQALVVGDLNR
jgi:hypothetical protein